MAKQLSDIAISELSLIFKEHKGSEWAPRNPEARVLGFKAGAVTGETKPLSWINAVIDKAKKAAGFPVSSDVPDDVDNDDDGADDYNELVGEICSLYCDLQSAMYIQDDDSRSFAIKYAIDNFLKCVRGDEVGKAGKRHSAADQAHIDALQAAHDKLQGAVAEAQGHADSMKEHLEGLKPKSEPTQADEESDAEKAAKIEAVKAMEAFVPGEVGEDGYPVNYGEYVELCQKAKKDDKKPYGDVEYADPKNGKYPIDTKEHAKAAWSYINMPKNAAFYSADELAKVKAKIRAACEKFGIEISDDSKAAPTSAADSTQEVDMTPEDIKALVAETLAAEKAEAQAKIDEAKAAAEKAQADAEQARKEAEAAKAEAEAAKAAQKSAEDIANAVARKPSGKAGESNEKPGASRLALAVKAANSGAVVASAQGREAA